MRNDGNSKDWRDEVNWVYVHRFLLVHLLMWAYGFALSALSASGMLAGGLRKYLGILAMLVFAGSLLGAAPIFGKAMQEDHEGPVYSFQVFLLVFVFLLSSGGYMWLLSAIALDSIELW